MFRIWNIQDVVCSRLGTFWMWDVSDEGCSGLGCSEYGMFEVWDVWDLGCWRCGMISLWDVWGVECPGYEMFGMWDVCWDKGCWFTKCQQTYSFFFLRMYIRILKILKILFLTKSITRSFLLGFTKNDVNLAKYYLIFRLFIPKVILKSPCYTFYYKVISPTCIYNLLIISVEVGVLL